MILVTIQNPNIVYNAKQTEIYFVWKKHLLKDAKKALNYLIKNKKHFTAEQYKRLEKDTQEIINLDASFFYDDILYEDKKAK